MTRRRVVRSIEYPNDAQLFDRHSSNFPHLRCPVCKDNYTHVQAAYSLVGDDESGGGYPGSEIAARTPEWRRDALTVRVHGETCGHCWDLVFQQHKGLTFVRIDVLEDLPASDTPGFAPDCGRL